MSSGRHKLPAGGTQQSSDDLIQEAVAFFFPFSVWEWWVMGDEAGGFGSARAGAAWALWLTRVPQIDRRGSRRCLTCQEADRWHGGRRRMDGWKGERKTLWKRGLKKKKKVEEKGFEEEQRQKETEAGGQRSEGCRVRGLSPSGR